MEIESHGTVYGVETVSGVFIECDSEEDARARIERDGGTLVVRKWYSDGWHDTS